MTIIHEFKGLLKQLKKKIYLEFDNHSIKSRLIMLQILIDIWKFK